MSVPGFELLVISQHAYNEAACGDLRALATTAGATFLSELSPKTTHVVAYRPSNDLFTRLLLARLGSRHVVVINHRWLENCVHAGKRLPEADYSAFGFEVEYAEREETGRAYAIRASVLADELRREVEHSRVLEVSLFEADERIAALAREAVATSSAAAVLRNVHLVAQAMHEQSRAVLLSEVGALRSELASLTAELASEQQAKAVAEAALSTMRWGRGGAADAHVVEEVASLREALARSREENTTASKRHATAAHASSSAAAADAKRAQRREEAMAKAQVAERARCGALQTALDSSQAACATALLEARAASALRRAAEAQLDSLRLDVPAPQRAPHGARRLGVRLVIATEGGKVGIPFEGVSASAGFAELSAALGRSLIGASRVAVVDESGRDHALETEVDFETALRRHKRTGEPFLHLVLDAARSVR